MSAGVVIIANRSDTVDYPGIALWNARRVTKHLGLPVTIFTDSEIAAEPGITVKPSANKSANRRYFADYGKSVTWNNSARWRVFRESPYETTLLIDADYVVSGDALLAIANTSHDFLCFKRSFAASGDRGFAELNSFGNLKMPMYWATVIGFKQTPFAEQVFSTMEMVEQNYTHYANLYGFSALPYRNDYALSIALHLANGQVPAVANAIPWELCATLPDHTVEQLADTTFKVTWTTAKGTQQYITVTDMDLHIMGKKSIEAMIND